MSTVRLLTVAFLNPDFVTARVYVPGVTVGNVYWPDSLLVVVSETLVPTFVNLMLTAGRIAPLWSETVPTTVADAADCALRILGDINPATKASNPKRTISLCFTSRLLGSFCHMESNSWYQGTHVRK